MGKVNDLETFLIKAKSIHGDTYDYSKSIYVKNKSPITIICRIHGEWQSTPGRHLSGKKCGCPKCHPNAKLNQEDFINRCRSLHDDYYDYSKVKYQNLRSKIIIICPVHGEFSQKALSHLQGNGCDKCRMDVFAAKISFIDFIDRARETHGDKYIYVPFDDHDDRMVQIICPTHGEFTQNLFNHLTGNGCTKCFLEREKYTTEIFIEKAFNAHGDKYDYTRVLYVGSNINITIICKDHGDFEQLPSHHLQGVGCPKCANVISQAEIKWLDKLGIPQEFRNKSIKISNRRFKPDAIDVENKVIYEFYGDFWHGNPKIYDQNKINPATGTTHGALYAKTLEKENFLEQHGYKIISIWESEFDANCE